MFSILHISDLHRSKSDPISNVELISALIADRERYLCDPEPIPAPNAIIVSGDIIQGAPVDDPEYLSNIKGQYDIALEFLVELTDRFLDGDRSRVVIVPGNHDICWSTSLQAMSEVSESDYPKKLEAELNRPDTEYRWDWEKRRLYKISDFDLYESRLSAFWDFFEKFYEPVASQLSVNASANVNLFSLHEGRIGVAAFNSCVGNDCFASRGFIPADDVSSSYLDLRDANIPFELRVAVWHHNIDGPPHRSDYMDAEIVRRMIGLDFRLGLFGHHHLTHAVAKEFTCQMRSAWL